MEDHYYSDEIILSIPVVDDAEPVWTGLYDLAGNRLYRMPEPVGFHHPLDG